MKRDINFIKHIKPQLKEKERVDKTTSRQAKYDKVCTIHNIQQPGITIEDIGFIASLIKRLKK